MIEQYGQQCDNTVIYPSVILSFASPTVFVGTQTLEVNNDASATLNAMSRSEVKGAVWFALVPLGLSYESTRIDGQVASADASRMVHWPLLTQGRRKNSGISASTLRPSMSCRPPQLPAIAKEGYGRSMRCTSAPLPANDERQGSFMSCSPSALPASGEGPIKLP